MPIKWKSGPRFKPGVILKRVRAVRTVSETGQSSFAGFDIHECTPALQSMLSFPDAAESVDRATLVWKALSNAPKDLNPETFLVAINPKSGSYPAAVSWADGSQGGSGRVILATT